MNEQTKLELMKIAAQLTTAEVAATSSKNPAVKNIFEGFMRYLIENKERFGS